MNLGHVCKIAVAFSRTHAPEILTGVGVVGVFSTAVLSARAHLAVHEAVLFEEARTGIDYKDFPAKRKWELVYRPYSVAALSAIGTVAAVIASNRIGAGRAAAAVTALGAAQQAFDRYKSSAAEVLEPGQVRLVEDRVAEKRLGETKESRQTIVVGDGDVLCLDSYSGRYFTSDVETIRKALNDLNNEILHSAGVSLNEYYNAIGLETVSMGEQLGWGDGIMLELDFNAQIAENGKPCLVVSFDREPVPSWYKIG